MMPKGRKKGVGYRMVQTEHKNLKKGIYYYNNRSKINNIGNTKLFHYSIATGDTRMYA